MMGQYILVDKRPLLVTDTEEWSRWVETADRTVAKTEVGGGMVSTVFLTFDHSFSDEGPPLLFETMVFDADDDALDDLTRRYSTWEQAVAGHEEVVAQCLKLVEEDN